MLKCKIFGYNFSSSGNIESAVDEIINGHVSVDNFPIVATINVDQLVKFEKFIKIREFVKSSYLIFPDGQPIVWVSKLFGCSLERRISGSDLFPLVWDGIISNNKKVLCIVPNDEVGTMLEAKYKRCVSWTAPYFDGLNRTELMQTFQRLNSEINIDEFDFVIVGIGLPNRELLTKIILENSPSDIKKPKFLLFGASFEFYLNIKKRAPEIFQVYGFEWLYRFFQEPKRLYRRYFIESWPFVALLVREIIRKNK